MALLGDYMRALVVEDEPASAKLINAALTSEGIISELAETGEDAIELAKRYYFDIILLDLSLPDMEGSKIVRRLHAANVRTPVLFLLGSAAEMRSARGLTTGDNCLTKPFHKGELIARIHAVLHGSKNYSELVIKTGRLVVDRETRSVKVDGRPLHVTGKEYSILELLSLQKGTTVTKEMFLDHLYGGIDESELKTIDIFVIKLRKKIAGATGGDHYIETDWGRGYALTDRNRPLVDVQNAFRRDPNEMSAIVQTGLALILQCRSTQKAVAIKGIEIGIEIQMLDKLENWFARSVGNEKCSDSLQESLEIIADLAGEMIMTIERVHHSVEARHGEIAIATAATVGTKRSVYYRDPMSTDGDTGFYRESFQVISDYSKCLNMSDGIIQKILCNVALVIELLRQIVGLMAQLIPFAGRRN